MKRLFPFVALILLISSLYAFDLELHDSLGFFPKPILMLPKGINGISWSGNSFFAISQANKVFFAKSEDMGSQLISSPGGDIRFIKFVKHPETKQDHLLVATENNVIGVKIFPNTSESYLITKTLDSSLVVNSIDLSPDGNLIVLGLENGEVHVMMQLYLTQRFSNYVLAGHKKPVYSVAFSPNSKYFLSAGKDGLINIWSTEEDGKKLFSLKSNSSLSLPVQFTVDSRYIASVKSPKSLIFRDFSGNTVLTLATPAAIKDFSMSSDGRYTFVLGENNRIYIFDLPEGKLAGYIPPFSGAPVTCYKFNEDETRLIIGYEDGSIFYLKTDEVVLDPKAKPPTLDKGNIGAGGFGAGNGGGGARGAHSIELRGEIYPIVQPYILQASATAGYTNARLLKPVYFGGLLKLQMAFPSANFPTRYYYYDAVLPSPLAESIALMLPVGFSIRPFDVEIEFFAEVDLGATLYTFFFPGYGFIGKVFPAFTGEAYLGAEWRGVSLFIGAGYDTEIGLLFSAGLGFRLEVGS